MLRCIVSLAAFAAISLSCLAQDGSTGAIRGTVLDPSGNRIAGATVALVNDATGVHYEQSSDNRGQFAFELLPPGDYSARVAGEGMSPQLSPGIHVAIGGTSENHFQTRCGRSARECHRFSRASFRRDAASRTLICAG